MILRLGPIPQLANRGPGSAWEIFRATQDKPSNLHACVSQPSHADLAGQIARALLPSTFGHLPDEVIETIGRHDSGWAAADLRALELPNQAAPDPTGSDASASGPAPLVSFLAFPVSGSVDAWRSGVRAAEARSVLAGILTSRHFCLLAPPGDIQHQRFQEEETRRRRLAELACAVAPSDLDRYEATLGFCDLLSLLLCSGSRDLALLPLAHPANPSSAGAAHVKLDLPGTPPAQQPPHESGTVESPAAQSPAAHFQAVRFNIPVIRPGTNISTGSWRRSEAGELTHETLHWKFT